QETKKEKKERTLITNNHLSPSFPNNQYLITDNHLYRTGDLARWLPDGNIEFMGRIDLQVKIRGFRIELGEIETRLLTHPEIKEAVVLAHETKGGDKTLCAYYVVEKLQHPKPGPQHPASDLKDYLSQTLPGYMIPTHFIRQEKIPLTPTGKIDRKTLSQIQITKLKTQTYIAPRDETEKKMTEIWTDILGYPREKLGIDDDFFQIGGHSLNTTQLASKIHKEFDVKLTLANIFENSSIRALSEILKTSVKEKYIAIEPAEKKEYYKVSSAQKRLYILQQMELESTAYNMPHVLPITRELSRE
ncbi:MAG: AMP-binding protein, partial [bacterium]|nr:AMP-binding protein [bacterium]